MLEAMTATLIDGKALAAAHRERIALRLTEAKRLGRTARLDAVLVESGDNGARVYAENQESTCEPWGSSTACTTPAGSGFDDIAGRVLLLEPRRGRLRDHGAPAAARGVDPYRIQRLIDPEKDVEGVNPANIGNIVYGRSSLAPCTALATIRMIESTGIDLRGKRAVVVGASNVVGKPIAVLLMRQEATVVSCNKFTEGLAGTCQRADVLVAAAGVPGLITAAMVKPGAVVIDVGVNRVTGPDGATRTVGDVSFDEVREVAGWISPVPGGVGPMTVAMLLRNVVDAAERGAPTDHRWRGRPARRLHGADLRFGARAPGLKRGFSIHSPHSLSPRLVCANGGSGTGQTRRSERACPGPRRRAVRGLASTAWLVRVRAWVPGGG
jgi:methylenetetrahydrofolate dehydrogenase (NADP+)/methenyltetrahydrofolate cyclohydrolase